MVAVGSRDSRTGGSFMLNAGVSSDDDGGLLRLTSSSLSFRNRRTVTMVGVESLFSNGDDNMPAGSSTGGSRGSLSMTSDSGSTIERFVSLLCGRGGSDIGGGVDISSGISSSIDSDSAAISSADADSGIMTGMLPILLLLMILIMRKILWRMMLLTLFPVIILQQSLKRRRENVS